jgi:hypothetical protein
VTLMPGKPESHRLFGDIEPCLEPGCDAPRAEGVRICEQHRDENLDIPDPFEDSGWPKRVTHLDGHVAVYTTRAAWQKEARKRFEKWSRR